MVWNECKLWCLRCVKLFHQICNRFEDPDFVDAQQLSDSLLQNATERWEELWTDHNIQVSVQLFYSILLAPATFVSIVLRIAGVLHIRFKVHCFFPGLFDIEGTISPPCTSLSSHSVGAGKGDEVRSVVKASAVCS